MQNLSDEDIDKLFKRAAEQQQTQFDPADWDNMASRLDASKRPWLNYYTWTGSLVLLGVVVWLGWFISKPTEPVASEMTPILKDKVQVNPGKSSNEAITTQPVVAVQSLASSEKTNVVDTSIKNSSSTSRSVEQKEAQTKTITVNSKSVAEATTTSSSRLLSSSASSNQVNQKESSISSLNRKSEILNKSNSLAVGSNTKLEANSNSNLSDEFKINDDAELIGGTVLSVEESTEIKSQDNGSSNIISDHHTVEKQSPLASQANAEVKIDSVSKEEVAKKVENGNTSSASNAETFKKTKALSRFAIKATIAPDFSSDQFKSPDKMGFNYGVMLEYFMNQNISVATGALWSRKFYTANEVDYNGYHADRAYGDCRMWDIPLNVNYYFTPLKTVSFFASAGLSSYLMNEENYVYEVYSGYGTKTYHSQVIKENQEWFKMLNVSVGWQKQINSRLAFQAEPFVKIPMAGVGEGNISLASFGSFFSIKYNF